MLVNENNQTIICKRVLYFYKKNWCMAPIQKCSECLDGELGNVYHKYKEQYYGHTGHTFF